MDQLLIAFATDGRTGGLALLILLDVVTGVLAALRAGTFAGEKLWAFLGTDVLKFGGYATLWLLSQIGLLAGLNSLGIDVGFGQGATEWSLFVVAVGSLLTSIRKNAEGATGVALWPRAKQG